MLGGPSKKARGGWEKDETIEVTARRETIEEAGVCGDIKDERAISKKALPTGLDERSLGVLGGRAQVLAQPPPPTPTDEA
ncbi:hypothetical protein FXO38_33576 [Capsicum annuum]|nr:hypothetical protein FXO38_33576 [Capsicum annuum]KAF3621434.1 hypothetical protein FXO37_32791 [Capsicum annuum]